MLSQLPSDIRFLTPATAPVEHSPFALTPLTAPVKNTLLYHLTTPVGHIPLSNSFKTPLGHVPLPLDSSKTPVRTRSLTSATAPVRHLFFWLLLRLPLDFHFFPLNSFMTSAGPALLPFDFVRGSLRKYTSSYHGLLAWLPRRVFAPSTRFLPAEYAPFPFDCFSCSTSVPFSLAPFSDSRRAYVFSRRSF